MAKTLTRCSWCGTTDQLYIDYHDHEWGLPVHDDQVLFEFLTLEGAQAGLSWITVLRKRENYRALFHDWDIATIANMSDSELEDILLDAGIIRNRLKVYSVRKNAIVALCIIEEFGSLDNYFWGSQWFYSSPEKGRLRRVSQKRIPNSVTPSNSLTRFNSSLKNGELETFSGGELPNFPIINHGLTLGSFSTESDISQKISKDLKKRGMSFVGSTIIYAFMQAVGVVDDHIDSCFRKKHLKI